MRSRYTFFELFAGLFAILGLLALGGHFAGAQEAYPNRAGQVARWKKVVADARIPQQ
jgi:hypothetical protein